MVGKTATKRGASAISSLKHVRGNAQSDASSMSFASNHNTPLLRKYVAQEALNAVDLTKVDAVIQRYLTTAQYKSAIFWADKRLALCRRDRQLPSFVDMAEFVKVLAAAGECTRLIAYIERYDLTMKHIVFTYYYASSLFRKNLHSDILKLKFSLLNGFTDPASQASPQYISNLYKADALLPTREEMVVLDKLATDLKLEAGLLLVLGKTYLIMQNRRAAQLCLESAANKDFCCVEALHLIQKYNLLPKKHFEELTERSLITESGVPYALFHFRILQGKLDEKVVLLDKSTNDALNSDLSIRTARAVHLYNIGDVAGANKITTEILDEAGMFQDCLLVHVAALVQLQKSDELFMLGHRLVDSQPDSELSWYTVGCYYYSIGHLSAAKTFLNKCTTMNATFGEGWLAFGHVLTAESEHEQAMNCYLRASRVLEGSFEPLMYIGLEYSYANNTKLAQDFLKDAAAIAGENALILHEQGCIHYIKKEWAEAEECYTKALRLLCNESDESMDVCDLLYCSISDFWEPLINNLGHVKRKRGCYADAIKCHQRSLVLCPRKASTLGAIALSCAFSGQGEQAVQFLHEALGISPHDQILKQALEKVLDILRSNTCLRGFLFPSYPPDDYSPSTSRLEITKADLEGNDEEKQAQRRALEVLKKKARKTSDRGSSISERYRGISSEVRQRLGCPINLSETSDDADMEMSAS